MQPALRTNLSWVPCGTITPRRWDAVRAIKVTITLTNLTLTNPDLSPNPNPDPNPNPNQVRNLGDLWAALETEVARYGFSEPRWKRGSR